MKLSRKKILFLLVPVVFIITVVPFVMWDYYNQGGECLGYTYERFCGDYETVKKFALDRWRCNPQNEPRGSNCEIVYPNGDIEVLPGRTTISIPTSDNICIGIPKCIDMENATQKDTWIIKKSGK